MGDGRGNVAAKSFDYILFEHARVQLDDKKPKWIAIIDYFCFRYFFVCLPSFIAKLQYCQFGLSTSLLAVFFPGAT